MLLQVPDLQTSNIIHNFCPQIDIFILRILPNPGSLAHNVVKEASAKYIRTPHCLAFTNQMLVIILVLLICIFLFIDDLSKLQILTEFLKELNRTGPQK